MPVVNILCSHVVCNQNQMTCRRRVRESVQGTGDIWTLEVQKGFRHEGWGIPVYRTSVQGYSLRPGREDALP